MIKKPLFVTDRQIVAMPGLPSNPAQKKVVRLKMGVSMYLNPAFVHPILSASVIIVNFRNVTLKKPLNTSYILVAFGI